MIVAVLLYVFRIAFSASLFEDNRVSIRSFNNITAETIGHKLCKVRWDFKT